MRSESVTRRDAWARSLLLFSLPLILLRSSFGRLRGLAGVLGVLPPDDGEDGTDE